VGHTAYVTSGPGVLHAIDLDTHSELWNATVPDGSHGIAVGSGFVFVALRQESLRRSTRKAAARRRAPPRGPARHST
jgi:hypothetical protein